MTRWTWAALLAAAALVALPLLLAGPDAPFEGADGQAQSAIQQIRPDYQPWASPLWEPPGSEVQSLLFALQAAAGAGLLGYYIGLRRGQARARRVDQAPGNDAQA